MKKQGEKVTLKNIADKLNFSLSTVCAALNNYPHIKAATKIKVLATARKLGYNLAPKMVKSNNYALLGIDSADKSEERNRDVTIYDIAEKLNISPGTVSRALNGKDNVKKQTTKAILEVAQGMGYHMNTSARKLKAESPGTGANVSHKPTIYDIATKTGLSAATVSRCINGKYGVHRTTQQKVWAAAHELGFTGNAVARELRSKHNKIIGVFIPRLSSDCFSQLVCGIEEIADQFDYQVMTGNTGKKGAQIDPSNYQTLNPHFDGLIIALPDQTSKKDLVHYRQSLKPIMLLGAAYPQGKFNHFKIDFYEAAYQLSTHLLAGDASRMLLVNPLVNTSRHQAIARGYKQALFDRKIQYDEKLILSYDAALCTAEQIGRLILCLPVLPDAILVADGDTAVTIYKELLTAGIRIPADLKFAMVDLSFNTFAIKNGISTISFDLLQLGRAAAKKLLHQIENPSISTPEIPIIEHQLHIRPSSIQKAGTVSGVTEAAPDQDHNFVFTR